MSVRPEREVDPTDRRPGIAVVDPASADADAPTSRPEGAFRTIERPAVFDYAAAQRSAERLAQTPGASEPKRVKTNRPSAVESVAARPEAAAGTQPAVAQVDARPLTQATEPPAKPTIAPDTKPTPSTDPKVQQAFDASAKRAMQAAVRQSGGSLNMRLTPDTLGTLRISLDIRAGAATVNIQVGTQGTADLLANSLPALRSSLESNGLSVDRLSTQLNPSLASASKDDAGNNQKQGDSNQNQQQWGGN